MATTIPASNGNVEGYRITAAGDYVVAAGTTVSGTGSNSVTSYGIASNFAPGRVTLVNSGTISATSDGTGSLPATSTQIGVSLQASTIGFTNAAGATITGATALQLNTGSSGTAFSGVNYGTINGNVAELNNSPMTGHNLTNYGTISGTVTFTGGSDTLTLRTGSTTGGYNGGAGTDRLNVAADNRDGSALQGASGGSTVATLGSLTNVENIGLSVNTLQLNNSFTLNGGTITAFVGGTAAGQHGEIDTTGAVDITNSQLQLYLFNAFDPAGKTVTLISNGSGAAVTGQFSGGTNANIGGYAATIDYAGGNSGRDVTLVFAAQPAPTPTGTSYALDHMTQAQAGGFVAGDALTISGIGFAAVYTPASGGTAATVALSSGGQTRVFDAGTLHDSALAKQLTFNSGSGILYVGTGGADAYTVNSDRASALFGFDGNDSLYFGGAGGHVLDGGAGSDSISGYGSGAAFVSGGAGSDYLDLTGSSGNLHVYGNNASAAQSADDGDDEIYLGSGANYVNGNGGNDAIYGSAQTTAATRLLGGNGDDYINAGGGNDTVNGNLGNDVILGGAGNDYLRGGQGNDAITGGVGNDQLLGDLGNDTLTGGLGIDVMTGGGGADRFVFDVNDALPTTSGFSGYYDEITDFTPGTDLIDLSQIGTLATSANIIRQGNVTLTEVSSALVYAQGLLNQSTSPSNQGDVVVLQIGNDTYVVAHEASNTHGAAIDTVIKLDGVNAGTVTAIDFA